MQIYILKGILPPHKLKLVNNTIFHPSFTQKLEQANDVARQNVLDAHFQHIAAAIFVSIHAKNVAFNHSCSRWNIFVTSSAEGYLILQQTKTKTICINLTITPTTLRRITRWWLCRTKRENPSNLYDMSHSCAYYTLAPHFTQRKRIYILPNYS